MAFPIFSLRTRPTSREAPYIWEHARKRTYSAPVSVTAEPRYKADRKECFQMTLFNVHHSAIA